MAEQEKLNKTPSKPKKEKKPLTPALKKAYTTWGIVTVVVSFAMFFASIITFVLVLLRVQGVPFMVGVVFFVAGLASGATGLPLLHASAREKAENARNEQQLRNVMKQLDEGATTAEQKEHPKAENGENEMKPDEKEGKKAKKKPKKEKKSAKKEA